MASEERLKVLKMVQEGKISAEDAIELLAILEEGRRRPSIPPFPPCRLAWEKGITVGCGCE
jgi:hypothetical protein